MYLFFDTETTGLPRNWKTSITDSSNWPRLVQIAWLVFDIDGNRVDTQEFIIKPEGYTIPADASRVHGITTSIAQNKGVELINVLNKFNHEVEKAEILIAHNINFDEKIVGAEFFRNGLQNPIPFKKKICTMKSTTNLCAIKGPYGYKWPKLSELYIKLFGVDFEGAHDASADIEATAKCFWKLKEMKIIS